MAERGTRPDRSPSRNRRKKPPGDARVESAPTEGNLPRFQRAQLTSFIGRERELAEVARLTRRTRMLTLTGPGGTGKTRLALEVASRESARFPDGVWWTDLAPLADPALVPQAVATTLELRAQAAGRAFDEILGERIAGRRLLLVLDNCEHLVDECARLAGALLRSSGELQVLATSREALGVGGEIAWLVPPLSHPEDDATVGELTRSEAVGLFVERAAECSPHFRLTERNARAVAEICRRLDGIPLALELAAARSRVLAPEQIAARLGDAFRLLTSTSRTAVPRQQTLRATMDWSYTLLPEPERLLFHSLSVFAGGFTLESVEGVCAGNELDADDLLDVLTRLADRSLVAVAEHAGEARYRLLETVRQYAAERLAQTGEADTLSRRHAAHFLALAESAEPELTGPRQRSWLDRLEADHDDLRAALRWSLANDPLTAARLAGALSRFWHIRGYLGEGRASLAHAVTALAAAPIDPDRPEVRRARAGALKGAGILAWAQGDYDSATGNFDEALALYGSLEDLDGTAGVYNNLGVVAMHRGEYAGAIELLERALALRRRRGDVWGTAISLNNLGVAAGKQSDYRRARGYYEESLALLRAAGSPFAVALCLSNLGDVAFAARDYVRARELYVESLEVRQELGEKPGVARSLGRLALVSLEQGDVGGACGLFRDALALLEELGDDGRIAEELNGIAAVVLALGRAAESVRLFSAAETIRQESGAPLTPEEISYRAAQLEEARTRLGAAEYAAAWEGGRTVSLEAATALAGDLLRQAGPAPSSTPLAIAAPPPVAPQSPRAAELTIKALGPLEVLRADEPIPAAAWGSAKPRELLVFLLAHPEGRTKEQIGLVLWPEASPAQLRNSFHVVLHHLRRALGRPEWVAFENDRYRFDRSLAHAYDVDSFVTLLERADQLRREGAHRDPEAIAALEEAVALYRGDFLEGALFGDWVMERQDELRRKYLDATLALGELLESGQRFGEAAEVFRRAIARDRLLERAHRGLMRSLARNGERERALRHFPVLQALLRAELDCDPQVETSDLHERIRRNESV